MASKTEHRASTPKTQRGVTIFVLSLLERSGIDMGGLSLIGFGLYGGQYAALFPENMKNIAGGVCICIAVAGLVFVVYRMVRAEIKQKALEEGGSTGTDQETG